MARRNLADLETLMRIYGQFSPEQRLKEELMSANIANIGQNTREGEYNLTQRQKFDPVEFDVKSLQRDALKQDAGWRTEDRELDVASRQKALDLTAENIAALRAQTAYDEKLRPLQLKFTEQANPINLGILQGQQKALTNDNSLFDLRKAREAMLNQEAALNLEELPRQQQTNRAANAASILYQLVGSGLNPSGTSDSDLWKQDILSSFGSDTIPATLTPLAGAMSDVPAADRARFQMIQQGVNRDPALIRSLWERYPEAALRLIPKTRPNNF